MNANKLKWEEQQAKQGKVKKSSLKSCRFKFDPWDVVDKFLERKRDTWFRLYLFLISISITIAAATSAFLLTMHIFVLPWIRLKWNERKKKRRNDESEWVREEQWWHYCDKNILILVYAYAFMLNWMYCCSNIKKKYSNCSLKCVQCGLREWLKK